MMRSTLAAFTLAAALFTTTLSAQTFLQEDWATGVGTVPPAGWSITLSGSSPAPWSWNNPGNRTFDSGFTAPFAICDTDTLGSSTAGQSILESPSFNASGTTLLNLTFQHNFFALQSPGDFAQVEVWDGSMWNVIVNYTANSGYGMPNPDTTIGQMFDVTTAAGGSANSRLRFNYNYGWDFWWAVDNVKIEQPSPIDMAMVSIDSPVDNPNGCLPPTGLQTVTVTVENQGSAAVLNGSLIQMDYQVNGGPATTEFLVLAADLLPGAQTQFTFAAQANLPAPGPNSLTVTVLLAGDADPIDDSLTQNYTGGAGAGLITLPYLENFDGAPAQNSTVPPMGWSQDTTDATGADSDWYMHTGNTSSSNTGPIQGDHTSGSGYYAYVEDSSGTHAMVNLISPCFDLSLNVNPIAQFWLFSFNGNPSGPTVGENFMSVDVIAYPGGAVTMDAFGPQGDLGYGTQAAAQWAQQTVNLAPFAGQVVQLRFRGRSDNSGSPTFYHDQCIDDVSVFEPTPTVGQASRPGMAAFDINGALNANNATVSSGLGGPYFASVTQGGAFDMSFDGAPNQPITVVYGSLNPVSATYPGGVGQFDIGGPGVDPQGIPLNIGVFVDAIAWASAPVGFPIDAMFFTGAGGTLAINFTFPNFGIPSGSVLTTFQSAITDTVAPFVYISNAIEVTVN